MANRVQYTYRARLVHLEDCGAPVTGDSGEEVSEDVVIRLSWPNTKRQAPQSPATLRAVARMATRSANRGCAIRRSFMVDDVEIVDKRRYPAR